MNVSAVRVSAPAPDKGEGATGSPLTILHVAAPARVGGLERVICALAGGHRAAGHRVHVAAVLTEGDPEHPFVRAVSAAGAEVHVAVLSSRAYRRERGFIDRLCRELRPSVLHTHGYRPDVVDAGVARRLGIPTVSTVHGFVRGSRRSRMYEWLQRRAYRRFDAVAVVSRPLVEEIVAAGVARERVHLIPNGWSGEVDRTSRASIRAELGLSGSSFHLGWIGRLSREKGADVLVEALPALAELPLTVSIVGDGPELGALRERARALGVDHLVRWRGFVEDASRLFPSFDAFVLSSRTEGTPIVLLEAMAAGVPIVATRVGGVPDLVTPGEALLVDPEDPRSLAGAIRTVIQQPEAALSRAHAAERRLASEYDAERWLARYERLYRQIGSTTR